MASTCLWDKIIIKLFASSWYIFLTYIYDARSHLYQIMYFCWVLFTFNDYSEFLASLVMCIHDTVGLCRVWITVYCAVCELLYTVQSVNYCILCSVWITVYCAECELLYTLMLFFIGVFLIFVRMEHSKRHQEQVEISFWTGMLGDILENSIFPGEQIVKILH